MPAAQAVPESGASDQHARRRFLSLDAAADRLAFPSRRALLYYLKRNPAPVYRRRGSTRYFMLEDDVDRLMVRAPLGADVVDEPIAAADTSEFTRVEPEAAPKKKAPRRKP